MSVTTLAITCGEPAGIGPEITLRACEVLRAAYPDLRLVLLADRGMLTVRARRLGLSLRLSDYQRNNIPRSEPGGCSQGARST